MAVLLAVLLVVAKVLLWVLAGLVLLVLLTMVLPVRATVQGECRVEGDLEILLEDGGTELGEMPEAVITIAPAGMARATVLGGLLGVKYETDAPLRVLLAGVPLLRPPLGGKTRSKTVTPEREKAVEPEAAPSVKTKPKAGFLRALRPRMFSGAKGRQKGAGRKNGVPLKVKVEEAKRWVSPEVRGIVFRTVRSLVRSLWLRGHVHAECGFGDPGATGMTYAAFVTWSGMTRQRWLTLEPNFVDSVILLRVEAETRFLPVQVAFIAGRFLLTREIRPLWRKKRAGESRKAPVLGAHTSG
jgi:hypothetical protein